MPTKLINFLAEFVIINEHGQSEGNKGGVPNCHEILKKRKVKL